MAYKDLQDFVDCLDRKGLLKRITVEVDPELEITEIVDRVVKTGGPALYFQRIKGSEYPLVVNTLGTPERMALGLGVERLDQLGDKIQEYLDLPYRAKGNWWDKLRLLPRVLEVNRFFPRIISNAACQQVVEDNPNLLTLPALRCWPQDGGRFITLPLVFTRDPLTGRRNCGMYRMQIYDGRTAGMHWHLHKDGARHFANCTVRKEPLEAAVALGTDPATIYAATAPLPPDMNEMVFAGLLRNAPVEMVRCKTVGLEVPAHAEFVLEGYVDFAERRREGPFGDHTGFYSLPDDYPVFHLKCLTRKKKALYPTTVVGRPPMEDAALGKATERIFLPLLKQLLPEIVDINMPPEGGFHNCLVVSIRKSYPGQAKKVMHGLWGLEHMMFSKLIIVVDSHVNVQDMAEVWWRVFHNIDAKRDVVVVEGPLDALDHASPLPCYGSKMGIDATRKEPGEGHGRLWPAEVIMTNEVKELVSRRWHEYGLAHGLNNP